MTEDRSDTRQAILSAAYGLFYAEGVMRVSMDAIAERAGVTKRTVYYHFASKDEIVAEALEVQHRHLLREVQGWVGAEVTEASGVIEGLFDRLETWAAGRDWLGSGFSRIAAELAGMPGHPARHAASRHKAAVEAWLAERLAVTGVGEAEALAAQIMVLIEGAMSLTLIHGDTRYMRAAKAAALHLVQV